MSVEEIDKSIMRTPAKPTKEHKHTLRTDIDDYGLPDVFCDYCGHREPVGIREMHRRIQQWEAQHGFTTKGMDRFLKEYPIVT